MFSAKIVSPFYSSPDITQCSSPSFAKPPVKTSYSIRTETHSQASPKDSSHKAISFEKSQENMIGHAGNLLVLNGAINLAKDTFNHYGKPAAEFVSNTLHKASQNKHLQKIMNSATQAGKTILANEKIHKAVHFTKDHGKNIATTVGALVSANPVASLIGAVALGATAKKLYDTHKENQQEPQFYYTQF